MKERHRESTRKGQEDQGGLGLPSESRWLLKPQGHATRPQSEWRGRGRRGELLPGKRTGWQRPCLAPPPPPTPWLQTLRKLGAPSLEGSNLRLFSTIETRSGVGVPGTGCPD